jgi:hypothetical protein
MLITSCLKKFYIGIITIILSACVSSRDNYDEPKVNSDVSDSNISPLPNSFKNVKPIISAINRSSYHCANPASYRGQRVGTGHCVSFIQTCSDAPITTLWREGPKVKGNHLQPGTIIATFRNGKYPSKTGWHAAIYISQDANGIWVWDQWVGKPVHKRLIRFKNGRGTPNNDGDAYSVVYR